MSVYTLAVSSSNHNSSICLLRDNEIILGFPCDRINRRKHTQEVLQSDINVIARYTKYIDLVVLVNVAEEKPPINSPSHPSKKPRIKAFSVSATVESIKRKLRNAGIDFKSIHVDNQNHHLYHAMAGYFASSFDEALCIVIDGIGSSWDWPDASLNETTTIFHIDHGNATILHKNLYYKPTDASLTGWGDAQINQAIKIFKYPVVVSPRIDIGKMYGTVTRHIGVGGSLQAGKLMGLSAYGQPNNLPPMLIEGTLIADANFFRDSRIDTFFYPHLRKLTWQDKANLAFNVQKALEVVFIKRVEQALQLKHSNNLILGGGCALNILGNSVIKKKFPNLNIYIEPIAADHSQSFGAAMYHAKKKFNFNKFKNTDTLFLGPEYSIVDTKNKLLTLVEQYNNGPNV